MKWYVQGRTTAPPEFDEYFCSSEKGILKKLAFEERKYGSGRLTFGFAKQNYLFNTFSFLFFSRFPIK